MGILLPERPEEYRQGKEHGCSSGHVAGGNYAFTWKSDHNRDVYSPSYLKGWQEGFAECRAKYATVVQ